MKDDPVFQSVEDYEDSLRPDVERLAADLDAMRFRLPLPSLPLKATPRKRTRKAAK